jgi:hypothetical protein
MQTPMVARSGRSKARSSETISRSFGLSSGLVLCHLAGGRDMDRVMAARAGIRTTAAAVAACVALEVAAAPAGALPSLGGLCCCGRLARRPASPLPSGDYGWSEETSLDLDAVSSACPAATSCSWRPLRQHPRPRPGGSHRRRLAWSDGDLKQRRRKRELHGLGVYDTYNSCGSGSLCDLLIGLGVVQDLDGSAHVGATSLSSLLIASAYALAGNTSTITYVSIRTATPARCST